MIAFEREKVTQGKIDFHVAFHQNANGLKLKQKHAVIITWKMSFQATRVVYCTLMVHPLSLLKAHSCTFAFKMYLVDHNSIQSSTNYISLLKADLSDYSI